MNRKFDLVIFDLDGTLFDTANSILAAFKSAVKDMNLKEVAKDELETLLGPPLETTVNRFYPSLSSDDKLKLMTLYRKHYIEDELLKAKPFDGIVDVLKKLNDDDYKVALATYKLMNCVTPMFEHYDIKKYFTALRGTIDGMNYTKSDIMKLAISDCKVADMNKVLMIGDTEHDFKASIECGVYYLGMTYGFGYNDLTEEEKNYNKFLGFIDSASEIIPRII